MLYWNVLQHQMIIIKRFDKPKWTLFQWNMKILNIFFVCGKITRILDDSHLEKIQHCLKGKMPNTYTMTKQCSENLVHHKAYGLPAGIFRPPIVLSTYKEPVPGWTDNLYGPSGVCAGTVRGLVHVILGNRNNKANLVPADYCVNAMISAAWDINRR